MTVTVLKDRMASVGKAIEAMRKNRVLVGIPEEKDAREPEPGEKSSPLGNAAIGYIMENGAPEANIPARPFLHPGVDSVRGDISGRFARTAKAALSGQAVDIDRTLNQVGLVAVNAVRAKIQSGPFEPLKPATLAARRRRGRTGTRPLLDTGQLRNSINYIIRST